MNQARFVELLDFENDYEIMNEYPFDIRCKRNGKIISESFNGQGYVQVNLNQRTYLKHRLIAKQFIPNPNNLPDIDHCDRNKTNYHIENLRWVSHSANNRNKASYNGVRVHYVKTIPDEATVVDFYETRTETHYFENYYYHDGNFYYDNDVNYRALNRFLQQHDLD